MTLWLESWHQVPCGSLPNNDRMLAHLSQAGAKWSRVRAAALRGWVKCSDGRLYEPGLAEAAKRAWAAKVRRLAKIDRRTRMENGEWGALRSAVYARDGYACVYCGEGGKRLECDHVVPLSRGGPTTLANLVTACRDCNRSKGAKTPAEWRLQ